MMISFLTMTVFVAAAPKKVYFSYTLHGNMNYDRYPRSTIWEKFPETYQNILDFIAARPEFKGQIQLSGQTFKTLQQIAPEFLKQASKLQRQGQIDITGTFYAEPVNVCMDGETNLLAASLGTSIVRREIAHPSGFFLQEHAWNPQLPWILTRAGVDWTPIRMAKPSHFHPFYAVGLDGTKIPAVQELRSYGNYQKLVETLPNLALILIGGDYELPRRFMQAYEETKAINDQQSDIVVEWIRVRDYLEQFPITEEEFVDNSKLVGIENWDSYSRWTADPLDIRVHTITKRAMSAIRAAKIAAVVAPVYARNHGLMDIPQPDLDITEVETYEVDSGLDWEIEHASSYPDVEPEYLKHGDRSTVLTRAKHLLAWGVNSDSRGWWPLYERRVERMESLQQVVDLSEEIMSRALIPIGEAVHQAEGIQRSFIVFNPEKKRVVNLSMNTTRPYRVISEGSKQLESRNYRRGGSYELQVAIPLPAYGFSVIGLLDDGSVQTPRWVEGRTIRNDRLELSAQEDRLRIKVDGHDLTLSLDPFQVRILAEMVNRQYSELEGWRDAKPFGSARVSVNRDGLYERLRIDRQVDWVIHLRQEYELREDHIDCTWSFTFPHPTLIRRTGAFQNFNDLFRPEGLMARLETGESGEVFYDVPFGITTHQVNMPSYVCALNFALLQQNGHGVTLAARTGEQAIAVDSARGSLALALGASTPSGPVRNPYMIVDGLKIEHESPWYAEPFGGTYVHEFAIYPFAGQWNEGRVPGRVRSILNPAYVFELPRPKGSQPLMPVSDTLLMLEPSDMELTHIERTSGGIEVRLNERSRREVKGSIRIGDQTASFHSQPNGIVEVTVR